MYGRPPSSDAGYVPTTPSAWQDQHMQRPPTAAPVWTRDVDTEYSSREYFTHFPQAGTHPGSMGFQGGHETTPASLRLPNAADFSESSYTSHYPGGGYSIGYPTNFPQSYTHPDHMGFQGGHLPGSDTTAPAITGLPNAAESFAPFYWSHEAGQEAATIEVNALGWPEGSQQGEPYRDQPGYGSHELPIVLAASDRAKATDDDAPGPPDEPYLDEALYNAHRAATDTDILAIRPMAEITRPVMPLQFSTSQHLPSFPLSAIIDESQERQERVRRHRRLSARRLRAAKLREEKTGGRSASVAQDPASTGTGQAQGSGVYTALRTIAPKLPHSLDSVWGSADQLTVWSPSMDSLTADPTTAYQPITGFGSTRTPMQEMGSTRSCWTNQAMDPGRTEGSNYHPQQPHMQQPADITVCIATTDGRQRSKHGTLNERPYKGP
ncbi:hypothetical protein IAU59_002687 [Kwoniella sp. CBS 9459]